MPLSVLTEGGAFARYIIEPSILDADRRGVAVVPYPNGTVRGAATADFYAIRGGLSQWEGDDAAFVADPAACVDVDLHVAFHDALPDAGQ
jgi:hypothetical protein